MSRIGVIGYGYWGPNIVRNLRGLEGCEVAGICDLNAAALKRVTQTHPGVPVTANPTDLLTSTEIDAIAVVTPVSTHFELAKAALNNGKHVFIEKPFTCTTRQAEELIELGERKKLTIMVDHTFLFTGAVRKMRELLDDGVLGDLYYYDSTRVNLGLFQHDVSVVWDLAQDEALKVERGYFHGRVTRDRTPINDGVAGSRVVRLLEAADQSLSERGKAIQL